MRATADQRPHCTAFGSAAFGALVASSSLLLASWWRRWRSLSTSEYFAVYFLASPALGMGRGADQDRRPLAGFCDRRHRHRYVSAVRLTMGVDEL